MQNFKFFSISFLYVDILLPFYFQSISGVNSIKNGYNPATWMLEVTTDAQESALGVDFAELFRGSDLYRYNLLDFQIGLLTLISSISSLCFLISWRERRFISTNVFFVEVQMDIHRELRYHIG